MFDIGWPELFVIGAITLIVVGPKEIPHVLRNVMGWVKKARGLARDFQSGVDDLVREADLDELKDNIIGGGESDLDFGKMIDPDGDTEKALDFEMPDLEAEFKDDSEIDKPSAVTFGGAGQTDEEPVEATEADQDASASADVTPTSDQTSIEVSGVDDTSVGDAAKDKS